MTIERTQAKSRIEKLVAYFEKNIHQLKAPSFNETQTRNQLIDPFFEALGWDVHNSAMKPLYLQEVVPEGRVKTTFGKESKEQTVLFEAKKTLGKEYKEYTSILDYIAEDEYKANSKEATKKPDYRFRIKGQTKFFLEAKKPSVDLIKSQDAIFQVKRYGFSGRVPVAILTNFEEFRVFDCTHKPLYEKPKLGIIKDFDFVCANYLDRFDRLFDTFSRDAVEAGSLDALTTKLLQKRTGDFALDKTFLEDLSRWRIELARDIAKHPRNRRKLNDYTLNESVQRILDRIVFFRVCEDREIEVENTLLAIVRMWKDRPGVSLYSLLNQLFQQRRSLYNGLLFSPHECEELEIGDKVILEILENLNYPFSPYHFNEIGVEILGSIYEKFLGKTIHLTAKTVRVDEKPEVRKAGGVYYTPQYIVNYIVDNTVGKLLYGEPTVVARSPEGTTKQSDSTGDGQIASLSRQVGIARKDDSEKKLRLSPRQVAKLKIIDIACGSGSFLLGAFQKLIEYHIEWYHTHPKDIQTINGVPDAYKDANGNLHISSRKKRDILVNNIYGVDIDRQAVEVTQMSLYLKVLEGENAETLNPQMTLALKEVYLPVLTDNIKCGNSLIGTDFLSQGELFDDETRRKVNPFDWDIEFKEIMQDGGFDCVIGNPPYGALFDVQTGSYFSERFELFQGVRDVYTLFMERALAILTNGGSFSYIVPSAWLGGPDYRKLREHLLVNKIKRLILLPFDVFPDAYVDTAVFVVQKNRPTKDHNVETYTYGKKEKLTHIDLNQNNYNCISQIDWDYSQDKKFVLDLRTLQLLKTVQKKTKFHLEDVVEIKRGVLFDEKLLTDIKSSTLSFKYFEGDVYRFRSNVILTRWVEFGDKMKERPREFKWFEGERILLRRLVNRQQRLMATLSSDTFITNKNLYTVLSKENAPAIRAILAILNSKVVSYLYVNQVTQAAKDDFPQVTINDLLLLPFPNLDRKEKMHDDLVVLVDNMLELHKQLQKANFDSEKEPIQRQIAATDKKIDELVYELYGLSKEERRVVEER